jgi:hypothetical protein
MAGLVPAIDWQLSYSDKIPFVIASEAKHSTAQRR